jgi:hypothetical protein
MILLPRTFLALILLLAIVCLKVSLNVSYAQKPARVELRPFDPAELVYEAEFSRALLRKMDVADFRFSVSRTALIQNPNADNSQASDKAAYSLILTGDVSSKGFFSKLFNLRFQQRIESTVDPVSLTVQKTNKLDQQGKRVRVSEAVFDKTVGRVVWTERDPTNPARPARTVSSEFSGPVHDVVSAIYYLRTQPLEVGKSLSLAVSDSGKVYQVPVHVIEKKRLKTIIGRLDTIRTNVELFGPHGMIGSDGQFSIWFTDDSRRLPVSARIKTAYGTFDIKLKKIIQGQNRREYLTKQE